MVRRVAGRRRRGLVLGLLLVPALGACGATVAQPAATPPAATAGSMVSPRPKLPDPSATPALAVAEQLDELAEEVTGGREDTEVPGLADLVVDEDTGALDVWWVGEPPERVQRLAASPPAGLTVRVHPGTYDVRAMVRAIDTLMDRYPVIHAASPRDGGSGVEVETTAKGRRSLPDAARLAKEAGMPVRVVLSEPPRAA